jgi:hypothetical protein
LILEGNFIVHSGDWVGVCNSVAEHLPSMCKPLGPIPSTEKNVYSAILFFFLFFYSAILKVLKFCRGWGQGEEMTQALYAHMNNKIK